MPSRSLLGMRMEAPYGAGYKRPRKAAPAQQSAMTRVARQGASRVIPQTAPAQQSAMTRVARQGASRVIPQTPPSVGQAMTRAQSQFANMPHNRVATEMQNQTGMAQPMGRPIKGRRYAK